MKTIVNLFFLLITSFALAQNPEEKCINTVNGKVIDKSTNNEIANSLVQLKANGTIVEETHTDADGSFSFQLKCDTRYQISAICENYSKGVKLIFTLNTKTDHNITLELIPMVEFKIEDNTKKIVMEPIQFEPDDNSITPDAAEQLDFVVELLKKYNNMKINLAFHSNNMGNFDFLKNLSQKRADICARYITERGIDPSRINAVGYGFEKPIEKCNDDMMMTNKTRCVDNYRTEFIVISDVIKSQEI